jgi:hypothetical protein
VQHHGGEPADLAVHVVGHTRRVDA